ncbi:MAG: site-2 protease family protein [Candidatus Jordarchaeum sp.]|uniref:site-2 protease family protein n=1 Tax=Candidatus Jordarchaeum sp. TaxID=2823881 RepID=UPI0040494DA5
MEELLRIIQTEFTVSEHYTDAEGIPVFLLPLNQETKAPFQRLIEKLKTYNLIAVLRNSSQQKREHKLNSQREDEKLKQMLVLEVFPKMKAGKRKGPIWNFVLLIATIGTVTLAGYWWVDQYDWFGIFVSLLSGPGYGWYTNPCLLIIGFTVSLLSIVGMHELGHYLISKKRGVEASLPFFIPGIPPIGTFGAVIVQRSPAVNKDKLFDIGLMGPLTGFIIAFFVALLAIKISPIVYPNVLFDIYQLEYLLSLPVLNFLVNVYNNTSPALAFYLGQLFWNPPNWPVQIIGPSMFADPLLITVLFPILRPETVLSPVFFSPLYFAAWVGFFITAINLFPIGMLDGGHLFRAILSRRAHFIASLIAAVIMIAISWVYVAIVIIGLLSIRRAGHPGALDDVSHITTSRKIILIIMIFILIIAIPPLTWSFPLF